MRAIRRKAETIQADTPALSLIAQTVETMVKNNLPPSGSPSYNMAAGDPMGLPGLTGGNTPTGGGPPGGPNFAGPISTLFGMSRSERQSQGGECMAQGGATAQQQLQQQQTGQGHSDDYNKVTQNPILTSLLQITGNMGSSPSSQNAPQPHQTPPPTSSPASNTKNHPMLMNLLKDNPTQDFAALYGSSPLERQNSSGSPRTEGASANCPGSGTKMKKKRRPTEKGGVMPGTAAASGTGAGAGLGIKGPLPPHLQHHQVTQEDDFHRELLSMDVDASQNSIFDVTITGDGLDTPHSITPAPSQCETPPSGPSLTYPQSHVQSQQQPPPGAAPPRIVRISSSDSIGPDITEILSDLPDQTGKSSGGTQLALVSGEDAGPLGTPIRDSSSSGQGSAVFDSDLFNTNSNENPFTDAADLIAEATATAATPNSDSSSTNFFPDAADFNPDLLASGHGFSQNYFDDSSPSADGDMDLVKGFGGSSQQNTPSGTPQNPTPHGQSTPDSSLKDPFDMGGIVFGGSSGGGKPPLGAPDLGDTHSGGSQSPIMMGLGTSSDFKSGETKVKPQQPGVTRPKDENGGSGNSSSVMGSSSSEGKQVKRSRTPSSEGKSKDKPPKRKKLDTDGKSPSHSSGGRPYTPPSGGPGSGGSGGGSKSPGSSGRSQTPPRIPILTIQIGKGTITGRKSSSHSGDSSSSSTTSSSGGGGATGSSKSHHSHSSSSGKIKTKEGSAQSSCSKPGNTGSGGGSGSSQSKSSSQGMGVGKPGSSPITKHGLSGPGGNSSSMSSSSKIKTQGGKPSGSLMNPGIKPNISPSHSRSSSSGDKMSSPMKSQVPGTPPSSKAKSPIGSGSSGSGGSKSSSSGGMGSQKPSGGSSSGGSASSSGSSSSGAVFSGGSQSQYGGSGGGSGGGGGGGSGGSGSSSSGANNQNNANNPNAKGKSPSRNKKPSLTAVIDKLKSVGGVGEDGCEIGPQGGPPGPGPTPGSGPGNVPSSGAPNIGPSKHGSSSQSGEYKREKSDKEAKAKVSVSGGNSGDKKMDSKSGGVGGTGLAKIIISKPDGGSPSIKAKVSLQKTSEGSGDSMRPQISSLKASPLFSGSTPKHDRSSPSHSRSPGYMPLNHDSESESGSSSVAEKSHQNSPSSDDDQTMRPLPPQDYMSSMSSGEKHKKHKKEKKKQKERERERDRDRDRDRDKEKKKSSMSMGSSSHPIKADSWSRSPISASDSGLSMMGSDRPSRPSPLYMRNEDDDLMDSALTGNL